MRYRSFLSQNQFVQLVPGQNDQSVSFEGGGICLIAKKNSADESFSPACFEEGDDVLDIARALLTEFNNLEPGHVALLINVDDPFERKRLVNSFNFELHGR